jgi:predicted  nucleic acid-binding Zn-ribbon protein
MAEELYSEQDADLLSQLEERVVKALEAVASLRKEKAALQKEVDRLTSELTAAKSKNKTAASRISKLLDQMELPSSE